MADIQDINRARAAKREWPETKRAFDVVRAELYVRITQTESADREGREALYHAIKGIELLESAMIHVMNNGAMEEWRVERGHG